MHLLFYIQQLFIHFFIHFLFDHTFVTTSYKRNDTVKISKIKNDTTNNILYLYCKQYSLHEIQHNLLNNIQKYEYDIEYVIKTINNLQNSFTINMNQRINIMLHCKSNDDESMLIHERIILDNLYNAFYTTIDTLGKHLVT